MPQDGGVFILVVRNTYGVGPVGIFHCAPSRNTLYYVELMQVEDYFTVSTNSGVYSFTLTSGGADGEVFVSKLA